MKMLKRKLCCIDLNLLPIKFHFIFLYGAMGGAMPFMTVLGKSLGISATAVGLVFTVSPLCAFVSKPLFGYITDYLRNIKVVVFILVCVTSFSFLSTIFITPIKKWTQVDIHCQKQGNPFLLLSQDYDRFCLKENLKNGVNCELSYVSCDNRTSYIHHGKVFFEKPNKNENNLKFSETRKNFKLEFIPASHLSCDCVKNNSSLFRSVKINSCLPADNMLVFNTSQFWAFAILAIISNVGAETVFCLSDMACYEILGERSSWYGKQRLWGTASWGVVTLSAGYLNDLATGDSDINDYSYGFYLMSALIAVDLLLLLKIKLVKTNFSQNICQDLGKIFNSLETVAFACAVYMSGILSGLIWSYEFWFLQELGATQTLMGLVIAVRCLLAEVPFLFISGWLIKIFGHFNCVVSTFPAFAVRLGLYYILENPWFILPIEILHGITFGLFFASMTGYASHRAPPGTEATMMGVLGALYQGLGSATGTFLGGFGFDNLGSRQTYLIAAIGSLVSILPLSFVLFILKRHPRKDEATIPLMNSNYCL